MFTPPTQPFARRTAGLLFALLLSVAFVRCDTVTPEAPVDAGPSVSEESAEARSFRITFEESPNGLTFRAHGAVDDAGYVQSSGSTRFDQGAEDADGWSGTRRLVGEQGSIVLEFSGEMRSTEPPAAEGQFEIVYGTKAYAGLHGAGLCTMQTDARGGTTEVFEGSLTIDGAIDAQ